LYFNHLHCYTVVSGHCCLFQQIALSCLAVVYQFGDYDMAKVTRRQLTSITESAARRFIADESIGNAKELACDMITGFHLRKTIQRGKGVGTWRFRYSNASGKRRVMNIGKLPAMSQTQAAEYAIEYRTSLSKDGVDPLAVLDDKKEEQRQKEQAEAARKFRTVQQYLEGPYTDHQSHKIDGGKHTISIIRSAFTDLLERDMDSLSKADVIDWQLGMYKDGRAHSTVVRAYGALKTMLRHAVDSDLLASSPIASVKLNPPPDKEQERLHAGDAVERRRMLSDAELSGIQSGLDLFAEELRAQRRRSRQHGKPELPDLDQVVYPHWAIPFTLLAIHTGLRPGDIRSLTWQELNIQFKRLTKTPRKTRHHNDPMQVRQTLNPVILEVMTKWHAQQGQPATGLVFPSPVTGRGLDKKAHVKPWKRITELGQVLDLDFYALRHHFISDLVAAGVPLLTVAHLAGHKSTSMIEKHYGHLAPDQAADALAMLAQRLSKKEEAADTKAMI
jgi:integrase